MGGLTTEDLRLASPSHGPIEAYWCEPDVGTALGAVLYLHWFDPEAPDGNRTQFRAEAEKIGSWDVVASLLPQQIFPWSIEPGGSVRDGALVEEELARLSACIDELARREANRIVLVGHDFGAMHGTLLMARDPRIVAGVLIAPANRWSDWFLRFWPIDEDRIDYMRAMRPLDPIERIADVAPRPLLLQFANHDYFIAGMDASELYNAAAEPKRIERYETDHSMRDAQSIAARREFILEQLA